MSENSQSTAILVIDMLKGFCYPDGASAKNGQLSREEALYIQKTLIPKIVDFLNKAHQEGKQVIYVTVNSGSSSKDYEIVDELKPKLQDEVWGRWNVADSVFQEEGFQNYLLFKNFTRFIVIGVYSDKCVAKHVKEARKMGYKVAAIRSLVFP